MAQEERVQELLHARQMAREIDVEADSSDGDKKKSALVCWGLRCRVCVCGGWLGVWELAPAGAEASD